MNIDLTEQKKKLVQIMEETPLSATELARFMGVAYMTLIRILSVDGPILIAFKTYHRIQIYIADYDKNKKHTKE